MQSSRNALSDKDGPGEEVSLCLRWESCSREKRVCVEKLSLVTKPRGGRNVGNFF